MKGIPLSSAGIALKLNQKLSKLHPKEKYWYISILGVDPRSQGQGYGTRLLTPVLERARREGVISYLETANPKNLPFYERLGFRVLEELEVLQGAPPVWRMATSLG
jgi:GNAT superfamily N-acetyltransferase